MSPHSHSLPGGSVERRAVGPIAGVQGRGRTREAAGAPRANGIQHAEAGHHRIPVVQLPRARVLDEDGVRLRHPAGGVHCSAGALLLSQACCIMHCAARSKERKRATLQVGYPGKVAGSTRNATWNG